MRNNVLGFTAMPFKTGESGNPGGRSSERPWREALRSALHVVDPIKKKNKLGVLADTLVELALGGDIAAIREIAQRIDGMPQQQIDMNPGDDISLEEKRIFVGLLAAFIADREAQVRGDDTRH